MPTYIEYELEDGLTILVQADEDQRSGPIKASRGKDDNVNRQSQEEIQRCPGKRQNPSPLDAG